MPRIFIGIPTLNRPRFVRETIASVRAQTYQDFSVVVSDNASSADDAASVADHVEAFRDPRFAFHRQPRNIGEYGQGRYFFQRSAGHEFFVILHDDDLLKPAYLERAVAALSRDPALAYFAANPCIMDENGRRDPAATARYLARHGRTGRGDGPIDVLHALLFHDFTPISGTFFRRSALEASGFVDDGCYGLYPFEPNVFLRLGDGGARAWFCAEELLDIRFHGGSIRSQLDLLGNIQMVDTLTRLFAKRRYTGACERRRRQFLGRLGRARALYYLRAGKHAEARVEFRRALAQSPSLRTCLLAPLALAAPGLVARWLGAPARQFTERELLDFRHENAWADPHR